MTQVHESQKTKLGTPTIKRAPIQTFTWEASSLPGMVTNKEDHCESGRTSHGITMEKGVLPPWNLSDQGS